ncbi:MAG TPA: GntG family PLP-dependent aldolase [Acidobacteriota bacterium]|nr:GntG family PLP-dependent aldolase [Acidobacteriota bacterium]
MGLKIIDIRSDTVTKPTAGMREAIATAEVGDDVYIEDPTVERLQALAADMLGFEASLFFPTGSMANQTAIKLHTHHGQEVIVEAAGHVYNYEMATMAAFSGALVRPVAGEDGFLTPAQVEANISAKIYYCAQTGLVSLENTHNLRGGRIHPQEQVKQIIALCHERGIPVHLDGARVFNAAVASGVPVSTLVAGFDTVMFCLSKGLGAPIGSILCAGRETIERARIVRKVLGGGMRQVGILAAAGLYALEHNVERLAEDHIRARRLAVELAELPFVKIDPGKIETNILVFEVDKAAMTSPEFAAKLKERGILCGSFSDSKVRMVTHLDFGDDDLQRVAEELRALR